MMRFLISALVLLFSMSSPAMERNAEFCRSSLAAKATPHFSGPAKPWTKGATPNSTYTHIDPKTGKAVQNAVYDSQGNVVGHVDFKNSGPGALSGHGHSSWFAIGPEIGLIEGGAQVVIKLARGGLGSAAGASGEIAAAKSTPTVFRQGTFADPATGWKGNYVKGQQWATDNPLTTPNYAQKYGLPAQNTAKPDWVVGGRVQGPYTTRPAPPSHNNPLNTGGATEVLPGNPNNVRLDWFHMPD